MEAVVPHRGAASLETARERLAEDAQAAEEMRGGTRAENTQRAYQSDLESFVVYCEAVGLDWRRATAKFIAAYLTSMLRREHITAATIKRARSGISSAYRAAGITPNPARGTEVRETLDGICRKIGTAQTKKAPLLVKHLVQMLEAAGDSTTGKRDRAILAIGFTGAFRRSEIVALDVDDLHFDDERGVEILLRRSKTDQHGKGRVVGVPRQRDALYCPVIMLQEWLSAAGIKSGPVFRSVRETKGAVLIGETALTARIVSAIVKRYATAARVDPEKVAGHSLRGGFVTQAAFDGVSDTAIMAQTGHKSLTVMRGYIQRASVFDNNASASIWKRGNR